MSRRSRGPWVGFSHVGVSGSGKTDIWQVHTLAGVKLGHVTWFTAWRRYAFRPFADTFYEQDCLRYIAQFCEDKTAERKAARP